MSKHLISPSLLSADFTNLAKDIEMVNKSAADWFHLDIMDGRFVPNITFGMPVVKQIKKLAAKPLDVHLMIVEPERYINAFADAGADILTVHYEASKHLHRTVSAIKEAGMKAGVALNPHTPAALLEDIITEVDLVLIMSVNPGFGGQSFIENSLRKITGVNKMIKERESKALIEVDGGVNTTNCLQLVTAGADVLVAGNAVFKSENPAATIRKLKNI
jgi:ribulose-phosphate 3-epimerase